MRTVTKLVGNKTKEEDKGRDCCKCDYGEGEVRKHERDISDMEGMGVWKNCL